MKILLLSRYGRQGASSRVRSLQYLPYLESLGWQIDVSSFFSDSYLYALYRGQTRWRHVVVGYWCRLLALVRARNYDLIWIEKEIFPFMPAMAERLLVKVGLPYFVDYDDALFHRYDRHRSWFIRLLMGRKIDVVMKHAALVFTGNEYLAEHARKVARQVEVIPTVVDLKRYKVVPTDSNRPLVVGWIGTPTTSCYLSIFSSIFESLKKEYDVRFVAVGSNESAMKGLPVEVWHWSEETEVNSIQKFDIGIMPLVDSPWEHGKCGYKLIQYMACGLPVVASPVGVNQKIVEHGVNGFLAQELSEWGLVLRYLLDSHDLRQRMGSKGRANVEAWYSLQIQAPRLEGMLRGVLR